MKRIDLTGQRFGRLIVLEYAYTKNGQCYWKCLCDCGNITYVRGGNLKSGEVKSCGCLTLETLRNKGHNMSHTKLYAIWNAIKSRCYNNSVSCFKYYGGKGITMCDEWKISFIKFSEWAFSHGYEEGLSIERINVDDNYCPENCIWIPKTEQQKNRSSCYKITYNNKTQNLTQWCDELQLPYSLVRNRIYKLGWSFEKAVSETCHTEKRNKKRKEDCNVPVHLR